MYTIWSLESTARCLCQHSRLRVQRHMIRCLSALASICVADAVVGAPRVGDTVCATMESYTRHNQVLCKDSENYAASDRVETVPIASLIVRKVSVDVH